VLSVERPRIAPILNRLEELKFARRLVCDADKRNRRIVLTAKRVRVLLELTVAAFGRSMPR
jgi:DNA-binding MarR family transcriptional regulator